MLKRDDRGLVRLGLQSLLSSMSMFNRVYNALLKGRSRRDHTDCGGGRALDFSMRLWAHAIRLSQAVHYELQTYLEQVYAHESQLHTHETQLQLQGTLIQTQHQVHETRFQMQQAEMAAFQDTASRRQAQMAKTLRVMRDMRREMGDMQAELLALRAQRRRAR
ncbi:hypothetical protein Tco_0409423 [Tanacetum coccineum]